MQFPRRGDEGQHVRDDDPCTAEHRARSWRQGRETFNVREHLNRQVASTRPSWPMVAALIIGLGVLVGYELVRHERLSAAVVFAFSVAAWACIATLLLGRQIQTAHELSLRDPLTGLPNRALLHDRIDQALARSRRTEETFALLVVDLDGFKGVNDVRGHEAGNEVLRAIARRLESVVRATDTVARVGGDEFVVLSLGTSDDHEAAALVGRLRQAIRRPYRVDGGHVELDASIGWALFPQDGLEPIELLMRADGQMYATKRDASQELAVSGRGAIDRGVVRDLESALERGQVVVHYQPIIDLNSGAVRGAEALVRRAHPDRLVTPSEFIPHVEQTPLVRALTLAVADDALGRLEEWDAVGHTLDVAVNVPYRMIDDPELVDGLTRLLETHDVEPRRLTLGDRPVGARRRRRARPIRREAASRPRPAAVTRRSRARRVRRGDPHASSRPGEDRRDVPPRRGSRRTLGRHRAIARRARPPTGPRDGRRGGREPDGVGGGDGSRLRPRAGLLPRPPDAGGEAHGVARRYLARRTDRPEARCEPGGACRGNGAPPAAPRRRRR